MAGVGKPTINIGAAQDEYLATFGNLDNFNDYYQSSIAAEIVQLIGKPRAHLFPNEEFVIYLVGTGNNVDYLKPFGLKIINKQAYEINPLAGSQSQISKFKFIQGTSALIQQKTKLTYKTLAEQTGLSTSYIKKLATSIGGIKEWRKWLLDLNNLYKTNSQNFSFENLM